MGNGLHISKLSLTQLSLLSLLIYYAQNTGACILSSFFDYMLAESHSSFRTHIYIFFLLALSQLAICCDLVIVLRGGRVTS